MKHKTITIYVFGKPTTFTDKPPTTTGLYLRHVPESYYGAGHGAYDLCAIRNFKGRLIADAGLWWCDLDVDRAYWCPLFTADQCAAAWSDGFSPAFARDVKIKAWGKSATRKLCHPAKP